MLARRAGYVGDDSCPVHMRPAFMALKNVRTKEGLMAALDLHKEHVGPLSRIYPSRFIKICTIASEDIILKMADCGIDFKRISEVFSENCLEAALENKDPGALRALLGLGMDPRQFKGKRGFNIIDSCVQGDLPDHFEVLLDAKVETDLPHKAILNKAFRCVERLCLRNHAYGLKPQVRALLMEDDQLRAVVDRIVLMKKTPKATGAGIRARI